MSSVTTPEPPLLHWIERSPSLHEARVTTAAGADIYAGYVATTPGANVWRGYVGRGFVPLGMGPRTVMQAAIEERVRELLVLGGGGSPSCLVSRRIAR